MPTSRKWILLINLLLIVAIYTLAANQHGEGRVMLGFFLSLLHTGINFALTLICVVIIGIQKIRVANTEPFQSLALTFLLSTALVTLLSFPACLMIAR